MSVGCRFGHFIVERSWVASVRKKSSPKIRSRCSVAVRTVYHTPFNNRFVTLLISSGPVYFRGLSLRMSNSASTVKVFRLMKLSLLFLCHGFPSWIFNVFFKRSRRLRGERSDLFKNDKFLKIIWSSVSWVPSFSFSGEKLSVPRNHVNGFDQLNTNHRTFQPWNVAAVIFIFKLYLLFEAKHGTRNTNGKIPSYWLNCTEKIFKSFFFKWTTCVTVFEESRWTRIQRRRKIAVDFSIQLITKTGWWYFKLEILQIRWFIRFFSKYQRAIHHLRVKERSSLIHSLLKSGVLAPVVPP